MSDRNGGLGSDGPDNWRSISDPPEHDMAVVVYFADREWTDQDGNPVSFGPVRDHAERAEIGFYCGGDWFQGGTGHSFSEPWRDPMDRPTHWQPLLPLR